ncbi:DUF6565 domain-containing protein [Flavobacterium sp. NG2]|uniref:DUF6565 domain-containing protein n=1 Tax=Flavobacterium sp. NG2 TaxID=3097547 RepID=UPI002A81D5AD|nr:DUF6565 domain-containing protein [Flavobacterium sp. NG2]WPR70240.1 DUF6565 domain-containing protein [Flavobacterium sp. NG2]
MEKKKVKISLLLIASALIFTACKDENQEQAEKTIENYVHYIDSITNVTEEKAAENWATIENDYTQLKMEAESAIALATDKTKLQPDFEKSSMDYEDYKMKVVAHNTKSSKTAMYTALLGPDYVNDDMKFEWVNKNNIVAVYENFVNTVKENKDAYSREDWDEIKLVYEALDNRKNTVEKEGLTSKDNMKIAGLKLKFAPMYTLNRMGAKADENAEAKQ